MIITALELELELALDGGESAFDSPAAGGTEASTLRLYIQATVISAATQPKQNEIPLFSRRFHLLGKVAQLISGL